MAGTVTVKPNRTGEQALFRMIDARVGEIAEELADVCRASLSTPYPPASEPGEPPHRRTGGLQNAVFAERLAPMEWAYGVNQVLPDPQRPQSDRSNLGLWMEFGTSGAREPFPVGSRSVLPRGGGENTASTGRGDTEIEARPFLIPVLVEHGPSVASAYMGGAP